YEMKDSPLFDNYLGEWKANAGTFVRNPYLRSPDLFIKDRSFREHIYQGRQVFSGYIREGFSEEFTEVDFCGSLLRNRMMNEMFHEVIPVILHEDDLNSMFYSIENRSPYLDSSLFDLGFSVPTRHLIHDGYSKYLLREAVKGILNDRVRLDRKKVGFNASIESLLDPGDRKVRDYLLDDSAIFEIVERKKIEGLLDMKKPLSDGFGKFLFNFVSAKIFVELNK
ncbi:MAG: asparagine synthase, partial [Candidatus Omnitrophica bacterium]|nr:asparagine synthase [Candidatus Omnitrophota bacterium]